MLRFCFCVFNFLVARFLLFEALWFFFERLSAFVRALVFVRVPKREVRLCLVVVVEFCLSLVVFGTMGKLVIEVIPCFELFVV